MTLEQLERRVVELEHRLEQLHGEIRALRPFGSAQDTFGMFADDPGFDEVVQLGREYREQVNSQVSDADS